MVYELYLNKAVKKKKKVLLPWSLPFLLTVHIHLSILSIPTALKNWTAQFSTPCNYLTMFIIISSSLAMTCWPDCNSPERNE